MKYFFKIFISFVIVFLFASCVSMQVKGDNSIARAMFATDLLLEGKISDRYIKVYVKELVLAEEEINGMIQAARSNQMGYAIIADNVSSWIALYNRIERLHDLYPDGLQGKKELVTFKTKDYMQLAREAPIKATDALYAMARSIDTLSSSDLKKRLTALDTLHKAKTYSNHLDTEINTLGAEICYSVAESLSISNNPENIMQAVDLYSQSHNWVINYKNAMQKVPALKEKAASLYVAKGDAYMISKNYTSFRNAKIVYKKAENIISGIATSQLANVNELLTIKLLVLFKGASSIYPNETSVIKELQDAILQNSSGPENLEVDFRHIVGSYDIFFANTADADLILVPAEDFGTVSEILDPVKINEKNLYVSIDETTYEGTVIEYVQTVTVFFKNNTVLYDRRETWNTPRSIYDIFGRDGKKIFEMEESRTTKTFISRMYQGDAEVEPNFDSGVQYIPGKYAQFFHNFHQSASANIPITEDYGRLNTLGKEICSIIKNL